MVMQNKDTPIFATQQLILQLQAIVAALVEGSEIDIDLDTLITDVGNVDTSVKAVTTAVQLLRWGIPREPVWYGAISTTPSAGQVLATKTVTAAMTGRVFGLFISSAFADLFTVNLDAAIELEFAIGVNGQLVIISPSPLINAIAAAKVVTIKCVAGGTGNVIAKFLYDEG